MAKRLPTLVGISRLVRAAALSPMGGAPEANHHSYPVPVPGREGLSLAFFHCAAAPHEQHGWLLSAPAYLSLWQAETGAFEELRMISPSEFGLRAPADGWLGLWLTPQQQQTPEFLSRQEQLWGSYDRLLAPFASMLTQVSPGVRAAAREFRSLFPALCERPLLPYYQALGGRFFEWVNRVAL